MHRQIIREVLPGSIAEELHIEAGDELVSIGGQPVADVFDYRFLIQDEYIEVLIRKKEPEEEWLLEIEKDADEDLGIVFASDLMDRYQSCRNHCIFCFIDQNPPGMRETLYFKDDDARLSFLQGNYVTLTNMKEEDIDRIIRYRMEPINISFHTTNPELRCRMLHNRFAGDSLRFVRKLADAGLEMNGQIVLCKGVNDGEELDRTIRELTAYLPALRSVSVVPVGLTKYRQGLYPLEPFDKEDARQLLEQVRAWQDMLYPQWGLHFVHASDEWYLSAGEPVPEEEVYDGYPQLENGVGAMRLLDTEVSEELARRKGDSRKRCVTLATGTLITGVIREQLDKIRQLYPEVRVRHVPVRNDFYGERITVTGLLTGGDLIKQLKGAELGEALLLPCHMLRAGENVFLDDVTTDEVERELGVPVVVVEADGADLCRCILGETRQDTHKRRQNYEQTDRSDRGTA